MGAANFFSEHDCLAAHQHDVLLLVGQHPVRLLRVRGHLAQNEAQLGFSTQYSRAHAMGRVCTCAHRPELCGCTGSNGITLCMPSSALPQSLLTAVHAGTAEGNCPRLLLGIAKRAPLPQMRRIQGSCAGILSPPRRMGCPIAAWA